MLNEFNGFQLFCPGRNYGLGLDECALLVVNRGFAGTVWMTGLSERMWSSGSGDAAYVHQPLIRLLHNIGFLGCITSSVTETAGGRREDIDNPAIYNYDDPNFPDHISNLRAVTAFAVHPAFRHALDIHP